MGLQRNNLRWNIFLGTRRNRLFGPRQRSNRRLVGKFSIDRFLLLAGIIALIPPAIVYLGESKRRDAIDNNIPHLIRDIADAVEAA